MEQGLRVKGPDPARARADATAAAVNPPDSHPAEKVPVKAEAEDRAELRGRPREAGMPAGDRDPEDRIKKDKQHR
jgi:hypothetical protein